MSDQDVRAIALFFFFAFLDEKVALDATAKATSLYFSKKNKNSNLKSAPVVVLTTKIVWDQMRDQFVRGRPNYSVDSGWLLPNDLDLSAWKQFQKVAPEEELLALIWSMILRISDEDISSALGISTGTLRYRVGRALRKLGEIAPKGSRLEVVK